MKLRTRIVMGFAVVLLLIVGLGVAVIAAQRSQLIDQLDRQLEAVAPLSRPAPAPAGAVDEGPPDVRERPAAQPISDIFIANLLDDGTSEVVVQGQLLEDLPDLDAIEVTDEFRAFSTVGSVDGTTDFRVLVDRGGRAGPSVIAVPTADVDETVQRLVATFALIFLLVGLTLGLVALWIIRLGLRPISAMTDTARAISSGDRSRRAPELANRTEAGELAGAFNVMLDQRDEAEDRLRRFASDASHELRTPLTSIRGYLDLYAAGGFREPGQLDDVVRRMQDEAGRMGVLVEDLLQLARFDEGRGLDLATTDIGELARDVVADASAAHADRTISAEAPNAGKLIATVDRGKIKQVLAALVDNAVTHAPNAAVVVHAVGESEQLTLRVVDNGPGLPEEQASQVFQRFYRTDSSRARTAGGSGLGLSIVESIAIAHGGTVDLITAPGKGCTFTITIPADSTAIDNPEPT